MKMYLKQLSLEDSEDIFDLVKDVDGTEGGFMIDNVGEMEDQLCAFLNDRDKLIEAQKCAGKAARKRQGAGEQQAQLILQVLGSKPLNGER